MKRECDIAIIGGGLAGLTLAALLGQAGFAVACIDAQPLETQLAATFDGRTTAVSYASRQVLERAGVWQALAGKSAAIERIDILDGNSNHTLTFDAREVEAEAFGWIVDNADLRRALAQRVQSIKNVRHITGVSVRDAELEDDCARITLQDGSSMTAALAVGADGRKSLLREVMGIGAWHRDYKQSAVVCLVSHEKPHNGLAVEHFRPEGPFALLPYTDLPDGTHRSALVWSVHGTDAQKWVTCDDDIFNAALQERSQGRYGRIRAAGRREAWPLSLVKSYSYVGTRSVLVAEAAHGMHPIAGQGLNMSLRDIAALADILDGAKDAGAPALLRSYQRTRRMDNIGMTLATDGLTLLFSNDILPVSALRRAGLRAVARLPFAKKFFMLQAMGVSVGSLAAKDRLNKAADTDGKQRRYR